MTFLSIQSAPIGLASSQDRFAATDEWIADRRAQATALIERGHQLIVAAPTAAKRAARQFVPDSLGFEFVALPSEDDLADLPRAMRRLKQALPPLIEAADVIEVADDGRTLSAARRAFDLAKAEDKPTVVVAGPDDSSAKLQSALARSRNPARRLALSSAIKRLDRFLLDAARSADVLVIGEADSRFDRSTNLHRLHDAKVADAEMLDSAGFDAALAHVLNRKRPLRIRQIRTGHPADAGVAEAVDHARRLSVEISFTAGDAAAALAAGATDIIVASARDDRLAALRARGVPIIAYAATAIQPQDLYVPRGQVERLTQLLLNLYTDRERLGIVMRGALEHTRLRTREAVHRRRIEAIDAAVKSKREPAVR